MNDQDKTNEQFELIFNTSPEAAIITRLSDGVVVEVNDGFAKLTGYSREETQGVSSINSKIWKNPEDRQLVINELLKNRYCDNFEVEFVRKNQSLLIGLISAKTFLMHGLPHVFTIIRDITGRKQVEEAMRQSEDKFRSLYDNMSEGSALHTLVYNDQGVPIDYLIVEVNPAFEAQLGISRDKVVNKTSREAFGVEEPPYFEIYSKVALTGTHEAFESYFAPLDKHFSISVYCPFKGSFATIFKDISERKRADQALNIVLAKYRALFDIFPIGISISDTAGKIIETNQIAETLLGISREEQEKREISGQEWRIIRSDGSPMPASEFASVRAMEEARPVNDVEMGIVKGDNQITWLNVSATPVPIEGYGVAIVYGDITERKQSENELIVKNEQLRELNATKDKFFSIIAHDLISPFNAILGFSGTLLKEGRDLDIDSILQYTEVIYSAAQNTYKLLENLLNWARMQQGAIPFSPKAILFNGLVKSEIGNLKYNADQKNIELFNDTKGEVIITADEEMLRTVLRNLISNAIKFTPKGGKVNIDAQRKIDQIEITVSDTGIGIEREMIKKLFRIETSFTTRGTGNEKGSGLGLLLCKEFAEKHGGTISVESKFGYGSRFIFSIPVKE